MVRKLDWPFNIFFIGVQWSENCDGNHDLQRDSRQPGYFYMCHSRALSYMQATSNRRDAAPLFLWETLKIRSAIPDLGPDIRIERSFVSEIKAIFLPFMRRTLPKIIASVIGMALRPFVKIDSLARSPLVHVKRRKESFDVTDW